MGERMKLDGAWLAVLSCSALGTFAARAQPGPLWQSTTYKGQEIGKLTGDVYYARTDDYVSAFMVTRDGIVLVEPVGPDHAKWLKGELARRFNVPVKYVIIDEFEYRDFSRRYALPAVEDDPLTWRLVYSIDHTRVYEHTAGS